MRPCCELCNGYQPADWRPGDFCVHCGKAPRREARCFWCARWVPAGGFCRECGAGMVDPAWYGAARMLKDAGVDRFTVPKMLREMEPEQRENFQRIYDRQAAVVAGHVDDCAFLQALLYHKHFAGVLDDELTAELPWPADVLKKMDAPRAMYGEPLARVRQIARSSPCASNRRLAQVARLALDDWDGYVDALEAFHSNDGSLRGEAALWLTSWRARYALNYDQARQLPQRELLAVLDGSPFETRATLRRGLMGQNVEIPHDAVLSEDKDLALSAALLRPDFDRLAAALRGDRLERMAASSMLAMHGQLGALQHVLRDPDRAVVGRCLEDILYSKKAKNGSPDLRDALLELIQSNPDEKLCGRAVEVLCRASQPGDGMRVLRHVRGEGRIAHTLFVKGQFEREEFERMLEYLIEVEKFQAGQFGMSTLAEKGLVGDGFVPRVFGDADLETKIELCQFAEAQVHARQDGALVHFLVNVAYGEYPVQLRVTAFNAISRWKQRNNEFGRNKLRLDKETAERFFGSVGAYARRLAWCLLAKDTFVEYNSLHEELEHALYYADEGALQEDEEAAFDLAAAVVEAMRLERIPWNVRRAGADFLGALMRVPAWQPRVDAMLAEFEGTDLEDNCRMIRERFQAAAERAAEQTLLVDKDTGTILRIPPGLMSDTGRD